MPSTFVHGLLPTGCALASKAPLGKLSRSQLIRLALVSFFLGNSPDLDVLVTLVRPDLFVYVHRYLGHNLIFMILMCWVGTKLFKTFVSPAIPVRTAWLFSLCLVFSHVVLDGCGDYDRFGVRHGSPLFYPFTDWEFLMPFRLFKSYAWNRHLHPLVAHATSVEYWVGCALGEMIVTVSGISTWWIAVTARRVFTKGSRRAEKLIETVEEQTSAVNIKY